MLNRGSYPQLEEVDPVPDEVTVFYVSSGLKGRAGTYISAVDAYTPDEAIGLLLRENRLVIDPKVFSVSKINFIKRQIHVADCDVNTTSDSVRQFRILERNPMKLSGLIDYIVAEYGGEMTALEKRSLRSVKKKITAEMGL